MSMRPEDDEEAEIRRIVRENDQLRKEVEGLRQQRCDLRSKVLYLEEQVQACKDFNAAEIADHEDLLEEERAQLSQAREDVKALADAMMDVIECPRCDYYEATHQPDCLMARPSVQAILKES